MVSRASIAALTAAAVASNAMAVVVCCLNLSVNVPASAVHLKSCTSCRATTPTVSPNVSGSSPVGHECLEQS